MLRGRLKFLPLPGPHHLGIPFPTVLVTWSWLGPLLNLVRSLAVTPAPQAATQGPDPVLGLGGRRRMEPAHCLSGPLTLPPLRLGLTLGPLIGALPALFPTPPQFLGQILSTKPHKPLGLGNS